MVEIIAEIGINHNGDLDIAKQLIDVARSANCDFVKFQKRNLGAIYRHEELSALKDSPWGKTYGEYKEHLEFDDEYWTIQDYCAGRIGWFASPWDTDSLWFLTRFDIPYIKVASAMMTDFEFLSQVREACKSSYKKAIISTGMCEVEDVIDAIEVLGKDIIHCIMVCTSTYPTKTEDLHLNQITTFKARWPWTKIGFSNHHPGIIYMPIAVALGAEMIEFHITLDRAMYGSDQAASIEPEGVFKVVKYIKNVQLAMGKFDTRILPSEVPIAKKLRRV